jgi:hypothetical protein
MADVAAIWKNALPTVMNGVTGRGVWAALNAARPVALDEGVLVLGLPYQDGELAGHLRLAPTQRLIEQTVGQALGSPVRVRIIEGTSDEDYELAKRRDAEKRRLQEQEMAKLRAEMQAKTSWDSVYEQLSRRFAAVPNKSLAQNRARFYEEALELVAEARRGQANYDELGERNFARCIERVAQYVEIPNTMVALEVLKRTGEL